MKKIIKITGLDCAACGAELEEALKKIEGVTEVSVSFVSQRILLDCEGEEVVSLVKDFADNFEEVRVIEVASDEGNCASGGAVKETVIRIRGLDCAACGAELEEEIEKIDGVKEVSVSFVNQTITLSYFGEDTLKRVKEVANHFEEVKVVEIEKGKTFRLKNLHCANCAAALQEKIAAIEGVNEVIVDFVGQKMVLDATDEGIQKAIKAANRFEKVKVVLDREEKEEGNKRQLIEIILSAVLLIGGILFEHLLAEKNAVFQILTYVCYGLAYLIVGYPVLISTAKNVVKGRIFDENFLMTIASIGAVCLGEYMEGVMVMLLYQIGEYLQGIAVGASRKSIVSIMELKSETATLLFEGVSKTVTPEELKVGDIILVKAGEKIPVDGKIVKGKTSLDTKSLTGESALREAEEGDEVLSGCINTQGVIEMQVLRSYSDSAVAKILDLVENASSKKSKNEKFITKFAKYYTPIVCCCALAVAVLVPVLLGLFNGGGYGGYFRQWINTALVFLVISCPCALIISVPLTYFGGIGTAAKHGILVKGATYLDSLTQVGAVAFDKTGTLTEGKFSIVKVNAENERELLSIASALENCSSHPLAKPFAEIPTEYLAENVCEIAGRGIRAEVNGKIALCGNAKFLQENGIDFEETPTLSTVVYAAYDGKFLGSIEIDDSLKEEASSSLDRLHALGVSKLVMLTGDNEARAKAVASALPLDTVKAGLLPDEKLAEAESLKAYLQGKREGGKLMYVGDGVNDAPVMAVSDIAVSMGKIGSGAAIEASDLVLVSDHLNALGDAIAIGKRTRRIVLQNIVFSIVMKAVFLIMGIVIPSFPLAIAVFGDVGVMLLAVLNSLRIRKKIS